MSAIDKAKAIDLLHCFKEDINNLVDFTTVQIWKNRVKNFIHRIYGPDSNPEKELQYIRYQTLIGDSNNLDDFKQESIGFIDNLIIDIENFDIPILSIKETTHAGNVHINLTQHQEVKIDINIVVSALQDELSPEQLKSLQNILNEDIPKEVKKRKVIEKLIDFGSSLATNVLASILTNPKFFEI